MSRTDKDRPYDVRIRDPYERHVEECHVHHISWYHRLRSHDSACDLDVFDSVRDIANAPFTGCTRDLPWWMYTPYTHVPNDVVHMRWYGPERAREVRGLREAVKEWNANGDLDDFDFPCPQHRRGVARDWY